MPAAAPLIRLDAASVSLAHRRILHELSWSLYPGQHWALLGGNGVGKSTFLRLIRGEIWPDPLPPAVQTGDASPPRQWNVSGQPETSPLVIRPLARMVSGEIHRAFSRLCDQQGWSMSGLELVMSGFGESFFPPAPLSDPATAKDQERAADLARSLGAGHLLERGVGTLSQGQLRLLLFARALVTGPQLLLLDEPFDGLDAAARDAMVHAVRQSAAGTSLVCSAHRREDIPACMTHALVLGRDAREDAPRTAQSARILYQGALEELPARFLPALPATPVRSSTADQAQVRQAKTRHTQARSVLELENVDVYLDREQVLYGVTWRVMPGEHWRIAGPNGSGKSTLLRLLAGLEQAAWGGVYRCFGKEHPPLHLVQKHLACLSDRLQATYSYDLSGADLAATGFDGSIGLWRNLRRKEWATVLGWLERLDLLADKDTPVSRLSSGTARRFFLARALVGNPKILLLDEPCSSLDAPSRALFINALEEAARSGVQLLYVSHHDADVPPCISHTLYLQDGRVIGTSEESGKR